MRILFISPYMPSPLKRRPLNFLRHLARRHELHVRVLATPHELRDPTAVPVLAAVGADCASVDLLPVGLPRLLAAGARSYAQGDALRTAYTRAHEGWAERLRRDCNRFRIDIVHVDRLRLARLAVLLERPVLVDLPDCMSWALEQWATTVGGLRSLVYRVEARRLRAFEGGPLNAVPTVTVSSDEDGGRIHAAGYRGQALHVPGIIEFLEPTAAPPIAGNDAPHLVFHGTLYYRPNVDAIIAFARDVLPVLRTRLPRLVLSVVGARPVAAIRRLHGSDGIRIVADVPQIASFLHAATAVIAPLRIGVGHSQKVCEGLLAERPVICSPKVARRVADAVSSCLLIASTPAEWLAHVERLLADPSGSAALAARGRAAVRNSYGAEAVLPRLEGAYRVARGEHAAPGNER